MDQNGVNGGGRGEPSPGLWTDPREWGWEIWFLTAVPAAVLAGWLGAAPVWVFVLAAVAIIPLAGLMGRSTEELAENFGAGIGGLLNATFGNAAELILALLAMRKGLDDVVKASLTGSILGNLLLVFGASILAGGVKYPIQRFNRTAAGVGSTLMVLAAVALIVPALFHNLVGPGAAGLEHKLSVWVCLFLMATYLLSLLFSLKTHKDVYRGETVESEHSPSAPGGVRKSAVVLLVSTIFVAWMSEILVSAVESASHTMGLSEIFMGVVVVAIIGNAAEHSTAILMALKNRMDLAVGISFGSALQIAMFVAPTLVFASYLRAEPMDLLFTTLEVVSIILAVIVARMVAEDGESHWLEGVMLLMVYAILALAFFFFPIHRATA